MPAGGGVEVEVEVEPYDPHGRPIQEELDALCSLSSGWMVSLGLALIVLIVVARRTQREAPASAARATSTF